MVAPLGDAQVRRVLRRQLPAVVLGAERHRRAPDEHALRRRVARVARAVAALARQQHLAHLGRDLGVRLEADDRVDLGQLLRELLGVALRHAPRDEERARRRVAVVLEPRRGDDRRDRLALGVLHKGAGVDDHDVGVLGRGDDLEPVALQVAEHHLGVDRVLWTAEGHERGLVAPVGLDLERLGECRHGGWAHGHGGRAHGPPRLGGRGQPGGRGGRQRRCQRE